MIDFTLLGRLFARQRHIESSLRLRRFVDRVQTLNRGSLAFNEFDFCSLYNGIYYSQLSLLLGHEIPERPIRVGSQNYHRLLFLHKEFIERKLNPYQFFAFAIGKRRSKSTPPIIGAIANKTTVNQFLKFKEKKSYTCSTLSKLKGLDDSIKSEISIDVSSGVKLLEKTGDLTLFLTYLTPLTLLLVRESGVSMELPVETAEVHEALRFNPKLWEELCRHYNGELSQHAKRIESTIHPLRGESFGIKANKIVSFLLSIQI